MPAPAPTPQFVCVTDRTVPEETGRLLREACEKRAIPFVEVQSYEFDWAVDNELRAGDMLYRPAVAFVCGQVEQALTRDDLATFFARPTDVFFDCLSSSLWLERSGISVPRSFPCASSDRTRMRRAVESLGGLPVVVKTPGGEGGVGTMIADTESALFSLVDY